LSLVVIKAILLAERALNLQSFTRYLDERRAKQDIARGLPQRAGGGPITLFFAAHDRACNHAVVLRAFLSMMDRRIENRDADDPGLRGTGRFSNRRQAPRPD